MQLEPSDEAESWVPVNFLSRSPGSRVFPSAAVHGDSLYVFGGHDGTVYRNDLLIFNLDTRTWELDLVVEGEGPSPRDAHAAVVHAEWMYVFGGYDSKRYLNDFHRFHFDEVAWSAVPFATGSAPSPRGGHTAVVHGACMFVFGGCDGWNYFNDLYSFSFPGREWAPVRVTGTAPGARSAPATVVHAEQGVMYVFGGYDGARSLNDLFRFDFGSSEWAQVRVNGSPPSPRGGHTAVVHGDTMYTFGGKSGRSPFNDLCSFSFARSAWQQLEPSTTEPAPRCAHVCVVHGPSLFVFGGYDGRRYFDDCFEYRFEAEPAPDAVLSLAGDLEPMVNNEQFSDVAFLVEGHTVHAHKFILFARCEYFRRMFTGGYKESTERCVPIPDVSHEVFLSILTFLYTGKVGEVPPAMAVELLGAANLYNIEPLKRTCAEVIASGLCVENAASVLQAADSYQVLSLRATTIDFMVSNFGAVVQSEAFKDLVKLESRGLVLRFLEEASVRLQPRED